MSEPGRMDVATLHHLVQRETESESVTELDPAFYRDLASFIGGLRGQEFDGVEGGVRDAMIGMATELASLLLRARLAKVPGSPAAELGNLLDEEKYILDSQEEQAERTETVLAAAVSGRARFLESLSQDHKTRSVTVRFLRDVDELVGADLEKYGPFGAEDVATVPYENAQALIAQGAAARVRVGTS